MADTVLRDLSGGLNRFCYPAYDGFYLALCLQEGLPLVAGDACLRARCCQPGTQALGLRVGLFG